MPTRGGAISKNSFWQKTFSVPEKIFIVSSGNIRGPKAVAWQFIMTTKTDAPRILGFIERFKKIIIIQQATILFAIFNKLSIHDLQTKCHKHFQMGF